ncbi:MAG: hydrogenase expression/synthesis HypA [Pseudonocardiales bacterium]|nr:hydrogenase expression/synthesis HypA [Pseudonocardiales bacterium]
MHELSICGAIADIATRRAGERRVESVHVRIGQLRQVVPDTLTYCWELVVADSELDGAVLDVEQVPARIECRDCGRTGEIGDVPVFACHVCNSVEVSVIAGEEFVITALDLAAV